MDGPAHTDPSSTPGPGTLRPPAELARTLGELRASGWKSVPVAEELRRNTMKRIAAGENLVPGVLGFDDTVIPQLENAILAGHDVILLGERGQAKTRVIRALVGLLDEWLPIVAGSEINDDPYHPVSRGAINTVNEQGDDTPITWVHRSQRYGEKLATPDTSIADLIGEVDPIKIAEGRYLSDELALHYGLIPRVNRGIFAINELPGPVRADSGGAAQRARGARRADPGSPHPAAARHHLGGHGEPRGLHQPRPHHHAAEGPLRGADPHATTPTTP